MAGFGKMFRFERFAALDRLGSLPSFAAQSTNGRNAKNRPFAALVANVSVADKLPFRCSCANGC